MEKAYSYLRTSSSDSKDKLGLPVQRQGVQSLADSKGFEIVQEFADDITGKVHLHARPQGKLLIAALLGDGVKTVICYNGTRIGRDQPVFWRAIELFRDNGITVLDKDGNNLCDSVMGGVTGMLSEIDRNATVARLKAGKEMAKAAGKRTDGRFAYGEDPRKPEEKTMVTMIVGMKGQGLTDYAIAKRLTDDGVKPRMGSERWAVKTVTNILRRERNKLAK